MKKYAVSKDDKGMFLPPEPESEFDILDELARAQLIVQREIKNLLMASSRGKLNPAEARDLVNYVRLLTDLKKDAEKELASMKDEELLSSKK